MEINVIHAEEIQSRVQRYSKYLASKGGFNHFAVSQHIYTITDIDEEDAITKDVTDDYKRLSRGMKKANDLNEIFARPVDLPMDSIRFKIKNDTLKIVCLETIYSNIIIIIEIPYNSHKHLLLV